MGGAVGATHPPQTRVPMGMLRDRVARRTARGRRPQDRRHRAVQAPELIAVCVGVLVDRPDWDALVRLWLGVTMPPAVRQLEDRTA